MPTSPVTRHVLRVLCLTVVLVGLSHGTYAAGWSQIGPEGGTFNTIAVDPVTPSTVYAGTGGGVFKSTDHGVHWSVTGLGGASVVTLAVDPHTPSTLYAGANDIFKSTDGGASWTVAGIERAVFSLAVDPGTPTTIWAGAFDGVWKSTDAGETWNHNSFSLYESSAVAVAIDPKTPSTVYTSWGCHTVFGRCVYGFDGFSKTTDGGATWTITGLLGGGTYVAIDPVNTAVVYTGNRKSTDGGLSWSGMTGLVPTSSALVIDPTNTATVYAATIYNNGGAGVWKSTDAGASWAATNLIQSVEALAIDPQQTANLYAGTSNGVFGSTDAGGSWTLNDSGIESLRVARVVVDPHDSTRLYAPTDRGVYISTDGGSNWASTGITADLTREGADLVVAPSNPSTLYAVGLSRLSRSTDAGATWSLLSTALVTALAVDPQNSATLYAWRADVGPGVSKSTDSGATWTTPPGSGAQSFGWVKLLAIDPANTANIYAASGATGLVKSTDGGATWAFSTQGMPIITKHGVPVPYTILISAISIDPTRTSTLYAGLTGRGIIKSTDAGASWMLSNAGLPGSFFASGASITGFAIDSLDSNRVYAGTREFGRGPGVIRSTDGGASWTAFDVGMLDRRGPVISLDPSNPSTLYAGTTGLSAFRRTATCAGDADCDDGNDCTIDTCDAGTDTCSHVVAADGTRCSDGFACTTPGTCSSGVCGGQGVTTADTCQKTLVPGNKAKGTQCTQEWFLLAQPQIAGEGLLTSRRLNCTDDDPLCDYGPSGDHACTFRLALCFNVTQPPPSSCTPTDVAHVRVLQPSQRTTDPIQIANRKALSDAVIGLGGRGRCTNPATSGQVCQRNSDCDTQPGSGDGQCDISAIDFSPPLSATNACTALANVRVPLRPRAGGGFARGTQRIRINTSPSAAPLVVRGFTLACQPHQ